jgi:1-acyl-sn-glycerol-3-phosphate acyltransferase
MSNCSIVSVIFQALMEIVMGSKIVIVGDVVDPEERSLIVMNHRTRVDWNYLWAAMFHSTKPAAHRLKFVLKSAVRHFPGLGKSHFDFPIMPLLGCRMWLNIIYGMNATPGPCSGL